MGMVRLKEISGVKPVGSDLNKYGAGRSVLNYFKKQSSALPGTVSQSRYSNGLLSLFLSQSQSLCAIYLYLKKYPEQTVHCCSANGLLILFRYRKFLCILRNTGLQYYKLGHNMSAPKVFTCSVPKYIVECFVTNRGDRKSVV